MKILSVGEVGCNEKPSLTLMFKFNLQPFFMGLILMVGFCPLQSESKLQFAFPVGVSAGMGTMGDGAENPSRTMSSLVIHAMPALKIRKFLIGPQAHYRFMGQVTDPSTVSDVNLGGSGYDLGIGIGWVGQRWALRASYDFLGVDRISIAAQDGSDSIYKSGSGFNVFLSYRIKQNSKITLDLSVSQHQFKQHEVSNSTVDLASSPMKRLTGSLGLTFWMGSKTGK